jgi:hypothetical protein
MAYLSGTTLRGSKTLPDSGMVACVRERDEGGIVMHVLENNPTPTPRSVSKIAHRVGRPRCI